MTADTGQLVRVAAFTSEPVRLWVDGESITAWAGQSVLSAVLGVRHSLRTLEFGGEPRAGFCLMGACQDCWMWLSEERQGRACTTAIADGMRVFTRRPGPG
jgi:D-hydroxyproline dehydrogenase subunit gamma